MDTKQWAGVIIVLNLLLLLYPALRFTLPVSQFDGGYYYTIAQTWAAQGFGARLPSHAQSAIERVSDYPVLVPLLLRLFLWLPMAFVVNGGVIAFIVLLGNWYFFLLARKLHGERAGLVALVLAALSVRVYYQLWAGIWPYLVGASLGWGALWHFTQYVDGRESVWKTALFSVGVFLTNAFPGLFFLLLMKGYWMGRGKKTGPDAISFGPLPDARGRKALMWLFALFALLTAPFALVKSKAGWFGEYASALLAGTPQGYPPVWRYVFLMDNALVVLAAVVGLYLLLRSRQHKSASLTLTGVAIVLLSYIAVPRGIWFGHFFLNFYSTLSYLLALPAGALLAAWAWPAGKATGRAAGRGKPLRNPDGIRYLTLTVLVSLLMVSAFASMVLPAVTAEERDAALKMREVPGRTFYYQNIDQHGFRSTNWVYVYAGADDYSYGNDLAVDLSDYHNVFVFDKNALSPADAELLAGFRFKVAWEGEHVQLRVRA